MANVASFLEAQIPKLNKNTDQWNLGYDHAVSRIKAVSLTGKESVENLIHQDFNVLSRPSAESQWKLGFWSAYYDLVTCDD